MKDIKKYGNKTYVRSIILIVTTPTYHFYKDERCTQIKVIVTRALGLEPGEGEANLYLLFLLVDVLTLPEF